VGRSPAKEESSSPETIVVGTNTFGVGQFIQPGYSVLPHTGLTYRIALGRSDFYGDNRSFDGYGLDVDVILPQVDTLQPEQLRALTETLAKP
jgi:C-terminal processing protease CtpA/Prc